MTKRNYKQQHPIKGEEVPHREAETRQVRTNPKPTTAAVLHV